ncbi:hypothetical protein ACFWAR_28570 [Streptomyces sp. NPDC059917]|uniref:hypothetical protein n=1 Tax=Streptomyces sp. NPDC059917 TaxID=3347002 RepID=UPI0036593AD1
MQLPRTSLVIALFGPTLLVAVPAQATPTDPPEPTATATAATVTPIRTRAAAGKDIALGLASVPPEFVAGGDWGTFTVVIDVKGDEPVEGRALDLDVTAHGPGNLKSDDYVIEVLDGGTWRKAEVGYSNEWGTDYALLPPERIHPTGRSEVTVRMRFRAEAELQEFVLSPALSHTPDPVGPAEPVVTRVVAPPTGGGDPTPSPDPDPDPSPDPKPTSDPTPEPDPKPKPTPDPGQTPRPAPEPGTSSGPGVGGPVGPNDQAPPGGTGPLASTGTDAATAWALSGAGVALTLGGVLFVGVRRARHRDDGSTAA